MQPLKKIYTSKTKPKNYKPRLISFGDVDTSNYKQRHNFIYQGD